MVPHVTKMFSTIIISFILSIRYSTFIFSGRTPTKSNELISKRMTFFCIFIHGLFHPIQCLSGFFKIRANMINMLFSVDYFRYKKKICNKKFFNINNSILFYFWRYHNLILLSVKKPDVIKISVQIILHLRSIKATHLLQIRNCPIKLS